MLFRSEKSLLFSNTPGPDMLVDGTGKTMVQHIAAPGRRGFQAPVPVAGNTKKTGLWR